MRAGVPIYQNNRMFDEPVEQSWMQRFGQEPPARVPALQKLLVHRSVREYSERQIDEQTMSLLIGAAESAATSSNLNMWSVVTVQDPEKREELAKLCGDQEHIKSASWFLCFIADHYRLRKAASEVGEAAAGLDYAEFAIMACIDASLAAERLVCAAEALGIGICYIGALRNNPEAVKQLLGLPEGTFGVFGLCLGYPSDECKAEIKPRPALETVWFRENYNREVSCIEYNERMKPFYESQGMKGSVTWSMRSARRIDGKHMTGREVLKDFLEDQGLYKR